MQELKNCAHICNSNASCIILRKPNVFIENETQHNVKERIKKTLSYDSYCLSFTSNTSVCPSDTQKVKVAQLCQTLCYPMDYTVCGILQARILEWVAFSFSRESSQPRDWTQVSRIAGRFFTRGSPRILEWVPCPFSRGSPRPGIELGSFELQEDSLPTSYEGSPQIQIQRDNQKFNKN